MADTKPADAPAPAPAAAPAAPSYFEVELSRAVSFYGFTYRPGRRHVVDEATLALMGDAVSAKAPVKG